MDATYEPQESETRQVYGVSLQQRRNDAPIDGKTFSNVVSAAASTQEQEQLPSGAIRDLIVATIALKYTQSNSVCYAHNGMVVGLGAGQQSRIHCTRLAGSKADNFWLRFHPRVLAFPFKAGVKRADKSNAIDLFVSPGELDRHAVHGDADTTKQDPEYQAWAAMFEPGQVPAFLTADERAAWLKERRGVALASDAFFPFPDNIHRAARSGVKYVAAPGGSVQDELVLSTANDYGMVVARTNWRLFHH